MPYMLVTEPTFQPEMSWLNDVARKNMPDVTVTEPTFQPEMSWLNADAYANAKAMLVTELTSQPEMSSLKVLSPKNRLDISVTSDVHQLPIGEPQLLAKDMHVERPEFAALPHSSVV